MTKDAEVKPAELETCSDRIVLEEEVSGAAHLNELDRERFCVAEMNKISEEEDGAITFAEGESKKNPVENKGQESLSKKNERLHNKGFQSLQSVQRVQSDQSIQKFDIVWMRVSEWLTWPILEMHTHLKNVKSMSINTFISC